MITKAAVALPPLLAGAIGWLDHADLTGRSTLEVGARDEPAHLATALLVLLALVGPRRMLLHRTETVTACVASMAIDIDHVPLYVDLGIDVSVDGGRPFTHSLSTIGGLAALAGAVRYRRTWLAAAAGGVGLHFVRDIATGEGLPLWWPWEHRNRLIPYAVYQRLLTVLAAVGSVRILRWATA